MKTKEDLIKALEIISTMPCITQLLGDDLDRPCECASCIAKEALEKK